MKQRKLITALILIGIQIFFGLSCSVRVPPTKDAPVRTNLFPNYFEPEASYITPDFDELATEFIADYAGRYVIVEGVFASFQEGMMSDIVMGTWLTDLRLMNITKDPARSGHMLQIIWGDKDREFSKEAIKLKTYQKVRVHGYVLPAGTKISPKTDPSSYYRGFSTTKIVLTRLEPLAEFWNPLSK